MSAIDPAVAKQIDAAFDYRGHVTVTLTPPAGAGSARVTVAVTLRPTPIGSEVGNDSVIERGI